MNQAQSRGFQRLGPIVLATLAMYAGVGETGRAAADDPVLRVRFDDPDAKALALRVHAEARAVDKLPRFSYRVESGNGDVETMLDMEDCTLPWLKQALDEPVSKERSFQATETLWSGKTGSSSRWRTEATRMKLRNRSATDQDSIGFGRPPRLSRDLNRTASQSIHSRTCRKNFGTDGSSISAISA